MSIRGLVAMAACALAASACSIVPSTGNPALAKDDGGSDPLSQPFWRVIAAPPGKNALPVDIVRGFWAAMADFDDPDRTVARQFLTTEAKAKWRVKGQNTDICKCTFPPPEPIAADQNEVQVRMKGSVMATIDPQGRYKAVSAAPDAVDSPPVSFPLVKVNGEWRIDAVPQGLMLTAADLERAYVATTLYYPDLSGTTMVADRVRVPIDPRRGVAETQVRRLLQPPSLPLRQAVQTMFPTGTQLNEIRLENDAVVMDFNSKITELAGQPERLDLLEAQLALTFNQSALPIEVTVNGEPFPNGGLRFQRSDFDDLDPAKLYPDLRGYFLRQGRMEKQGKQADELIPLAGPVSDPSRPFSDPAVREPAIGEPGVTKVAAKREGTNDVWVADASPVGQWQSWIPGLGGGLTPPSWDRYGDVWSVERTDTGSRVWRARNGQAYQVSAPALDNARVVSFRVARDGVHVAVVTESAGRQNVQVGLIVRSGGFRLDGFEELVPAEEGTTTRNVAWQDDGTLAVLSTPEDPQGIKVMKSFSIADGEEVAPKLVSPEFRVTGFSAAPKNLLAVDDKGTLRSYDGMKWVKVPGGPKGISHLVYPLG